MEQAVAAGLSEGGDWCDLYFEYTVYNDLLLKDGEVNDGGYNEDFGVGIRVLDGDRTGYAYSESAARHLSYRQGQWDGTVRAAVA